MTQAETLLEFDQIKKIWKEQVLTAQAKLEIDEMEPYLSENELRAKLRETTEARSLIEKWGNPPLVSLNGVWELVMIAKKGGCLSACQLEEAGAALVAVKRIKDYLSKGKQDGIPLAYDEEKLEELEEVRETIHLQIRGGKVDDYATKALKSLRSERERKENRMRERADGVLRSKKEYMSDQFSTFRNGHICIPVKKEYRTKVEGNVIEQSATGNTLFIEPASVARYNDELQMLRIEEENEERKVLYTLTGMIADAAEIIECNMRMIERLDFIFSKGKLSLYYEGVQPDINTERRIVLKDGRHPLMDKKTCVPLQFKIGNGINGIIITGPNTGGKTVAIKTVALNCIMTQCGLHVACGEADICMNSNFLCDIGDGQSLAENLSTFSAHIQSVLEILKNINKDSLVVMDELGSGTDPAEGMGIAISILEELKKSGALFLVTTHYPEVKQYAEREEGIINARMTFDKESLNPLYQLVIGEAGESCAFYIAYKLGMPGSMLKRAVTEAYGEEMLGKMEWLDGNTAIEKKTNPHIIKCRKKTDTRQKAIQFQLGDSVMVYPDKKIGIVCRKADDKGVLRVQLPNQKIWINHKRVKRLVAAEKLYPEDYDFSIIFDTVENRKLRHKMERKRVEGVIEYEEE